MSVLLRATGGLLGLAPRRFDSVEATRGLGAHPRTDAALPGRLRRRYDVTTRLHAGRAVVTLAPKGGVSPAVIVYLHGGAYVNAMIGPHWWVVDQLIRRTGATVVVPSYPLAPEVTAPDAYAWIAPVLAQVRADAGGRPVVLAGDSAGAGFAAGLALARPEAADALVLFSPWLDVTMDNPDIAPLEKRDVILGVPGLRYWGRAWAGAWSVDDPRVSPMFGALADLPPTRVYQGDRDIFLPDARAFTAAATSAGADVRLREYADGFHVFVVATFTAEARDVFADVARFVAATTRR